MANFKDIIGQDQIKTHLLDGILQGNISHAYIINGETGSGRRLLASALTKALLCENRSAQGDACGVCKSCKQVDTNNHPDVRFVTHEKASISVDDIREQINDTIMVRPYSSQYKIYIVDEAQKMTVQAQNALLKTIEEPPAYADHAFDYKPGCIFTDHSFTVCAAETETIKRLCCEDLSGRKASGKGHSGRNIQCICKRKSGQSNSSGPVRGL